MSELPDPEFDTDDAARFIRGYGMRSQVLGAEHVARSGGANRDEANDIQRLITQIGWGTVWPRGVLEIKTRSMITVAMLIALNRPHELRVHLRGAVNNGATEEELREAVLHSILYCGFPAAIDAMRHVDELFNDDAETK